MSRLSLGLDTSNYTTSAALTDSIGNIVAEKRVLLKVKPGEKGLRQSDALYQHWQNLPVILEEMLRDYGRDIACVSASTRPRPQEGSYMPVFNAGKAAGQMLAAQADIPFWEFSHQEGHVTAAAYGNDVDFSEPVICAHLSGGTLELVLVKDGIYTIIGGTKDISYGQLLDRAGVDIGYPFPAGKYIDELACGFVRKDEKTPFSRVFCDKTYLNLSGTETQLKSAKNNFEKDAIAYFLMERISESFVKICNYAKEETGAQQVLVAGGVACSSFLRMFCEKENYMFGQPFLCSDNAAGISLMGGRKCL